MAMHFSFTPHHVQLIAACYPPSAALLATAPEYKPNSQELSRLTYYASNRPGKIAKLSAELQRRINADVKKARTGNTRARASLLISLNIFKALVAECRRDLTLLSGSLMSALDVTMEAFSSDLEIAAKSATVFTAWTTYTTGQPLGVDEGVTRDYMATLRRFAAMCIAESSSSDEEMRSRTRLIGLAAITGAITSEALYNSSTQFKSQVAALIPALVLNVRQTSINILNAEVEHMKDIPVSFSPYISEFRTRPLIERRAASIHIHIDGERGPSMAEVASATLRALSCLLSQSKGAQVGLVLRAALDSLNQQNGWSSIDHCCWFSQKAVEWTQYQYRFAIPSRLVERLSEIQDSPNSPSERKALAAMIKSVFKSPTPLVNVSTSDILSTITSLILQRVTVDAEDPALLDLVDCIGALGTHIYYADQIHDLVCDLVARLISIEANGVSGRGRDLGRRERGRIHALRALIVAIGKLICPRVDRHQAKAAEDVSSFQERKSLEDPKVSSQPTVLHENIRTSSPKPTHDTASIPSVTHVSASPPRTKVPLDVFQDTLPFLCDEEFSIRADYARALTSFVSSEMRKEGSKSESLSSINEHMDRGRDDGGRVGRRASVLVQQKLTGCCARPSISSVPSPDSSRIRFLHAIHAAIYVLATSSCLSYQSSSPPSPAHSMEGGHESPAVMVTVSPSTPLREEPSGSPDDTMDTSQASASTRRRSLHISSHSRKISVMRKLLEQANAQSRYPSTSLSPPTPVTTISSDIATSATSSDFVHILTILATTHQQVPRRALLTGVPMLKTLENWCKELHTASGDKQLLQRQQAVKELIARMWIVIGEHWEIPELTHLAENAVKSEFNDVFTSLVPAESLFPQPEDPIPLSVLYSENSESRSVLVDTDAAIDMLASSAKLQSSIGLDKLTLLRLLNVPWSLEAALRESFAGSDGKDGIRTDSLSPVLKISPALMQISNMSLQSLARSTRGVAVSDLRDALHGRSNASNLALNQKPASISSYGDAATHSAASGDSHGVANVPGLFRPKSRSRATNGEGPKDVRDVLDKLGIGAKNGANLLKASFSARQKSARASVLVPPYKS